MPENDSLHRRTLWKALALLAAASAAVWFLMLQPATADDPPSSPVIPEVVATIGEDEVSLKDIEAEVAAQLTQLEAQRFEYLEQALETVVRNRLMAKEAAALGMSERDIIDTEIIGKLTVPTERDVEAFYEENRDRIGQPLEGVAEQIRQYLTTQRRVEATEAFYNGLRKKYGVQEFLPKPDVMRLPIDLAGAPVGGEEDAPVTLVEFSDFQCPYCARVVPTIERVKQEYGERVRVVFKQFPLRSIHPQAQKAAEASLCANDQGRFWEFHDAMFANQQALAVDALKAKADELQLDGTAFAECLDSGKYAEQVQADLDEGTALGVTGTPAMFVNGRRLDGGAVPFEMIAELIDDELDRAGVDRNSDS